VDDIPISANSKEAMIGAKKTLSRHFDIVDLGPVKWLLGIHIQRDRQKRLIHLSQEAYVDTIVKRFNLQDGFKVSTPLDPHVRLSKSLSPKTDSEKEKMNSIPYAEAVGSLMYLTMGTRPDVSFAVQSLSKYLSNPGRAHWTAVQRTIRYINATRELKLTLGGMEPILLSGCTDADWAGDLDNRTSVSGYAFNLGSGSISWSSKGQGCVAGSSTEAEYVAADYAAKEAVWLRALLKFLGYEQGNPTIIQCDNNGAISLTKNAAFHNRTKHIDVKYHAVRRYVDQRVIGFEYLSTQEMAADVFTKGLERPKHWKFLRMHGLTGCNEKQ